jgi:hypothetical protein
VESRASGRGQHVREGERKPFAAVAVSRILFYFSGLLLEYALGSTGRRKKGLWGERGLCSSYYRAYFVRTGEYEVRYRLGPFKALCDAT